MQEYLPYILTAVAVVIMFIVAYIILSKPMCPNCKQRKADFVKKEFLREETVYFRETETIKEYSNTGGAVTDFGLKGQTLKPPEKVVTREVKIPGKRKWYQVTYKCRQCGELFSRKEYVDEKPTII